MPKQPSTSEVRYRYTPIYVDMHGGLYAGSQKTKTLKPEIPNTSATEPSSPNLFGTTSSEFGYTLGNAANAGSATGTMKPEPIISEETANRIKSLISSPVYAKGLLAGMLDGVPLRVSSLVGLVALPTLPAMIALDYASGRSVDRATRANAAGFAAGYVSSAVTNIIIKDLVKVHFAGRAAMAGARVGNAAGALAGFVAGIIAYNVASSIIDRWPDSSDRAFFGYDDFPHSDPYYEYIPSYLDDKFIPYP